MIRSVRGGMCEKDKEPLSRDCQVELRTYARAIHADSAHVTGPLPTKNESGL